MYRFTLVLPAVFLVALAFSAQPASTSTPQMTPTNAAIPVEATKQPNPVKATPESIAHAQKWWTLDCAMCHGKDGDGKGETAKDMKLTMMNFTDPATLKDRTDGEIFYIIKNGKGQMPGEGDRAKPDVIWNMVVLVRSFGKK